MSDEKINGSALELEEKIAVGAVFLLAGWFLWQFLGHDSTVPSVSSESDALESTSRVRLFQDEDGVQVNEAVQASINTEPVMIEQSPVAVQAVTEPVDSVQKRRVNRGGGVVSPSASVSAKPDLALAPVTARPVKPLVERVKQPAVPVISEPVERIAKTVPPVIPAMPEPEPVKKIVETVTPAIVTKSVSTRVVPTIQPVSSDLSQGLLRLSGTGRPGGHLQLLLNGRKASNIPVDANGHWHYESNLKPGEYSVQVLSMELDEQLSVQSALANVTISEPPPPVPEAVVKHADPVIDPVVTKAPEKQQQPVSSQQKLNDRFYKVRSGDTLNKLARRFRVSLHSLIKANNISDKDQIEVGQMLIIPGRYPGGK